MSEQKKHMIPKDSLSCEHSDCEPVVIIDYGEDSQSGSVPLFGGNWQLVSTNSNFRNTRVRKNALFEADHD